MSETANDRMDAAKALFHEHPARVIFYRDEDLQRPTDAVPGEHPSYGRIWVHWSGGSVAAVADELESEARQYKWPWNIEWIGHDEWARRWYIYRASEERV